MLMFSTFSSWITDMGWTHLRRRVRLMADYQCEACGLQESDQRAQRTDGGGLHIHHIWPRRYGGRDARRNLMALCDDCHAQIEATTRHIVEYGGGSEEDVRLMAARKRANGHRQNTPFHVAAIRRKGR